MIQKYHFDKLNPGDLVRIEERWLSRDMKGNRWYLVIGDSKFGSDRIDIFITDKRRASIYISNIIDVKRVI